MWHRNLRPDDSILFFVAGVSSTLFAQFQEFTNPLERDMLRINRLLFKTGSRVEIVCCSSLRR